MITHHPFILASDPPLKNVSINREIISESFEKTKFPIHKPKNYSWGVLIFKTWDAWKRNQNLPPPPKIKYPLTSIRPANAWGSNAPCKPGPPPPRKRERSSPGEGWRINARFVPGSEYPAALRGNTAFYFAGLFVFVSLTAPPPHTRPVTAVRGRGRPRYFII